MFNRYLINIKDMKNTLFSNNPIKIKDKRSDALEEAYSMFINILEEYAESNNLPEEYFSEVKLMINDAYLSKKASYFFEQKIENISDRMERMVEFALNKNSKNDVNYTNLFYLNRTNHLITNE